MRHLTTSVVVIVCLALAVAACGDISQSYGGTVYYVSAVRGDASNNGRTWQTAKDTIQAAIEQIEQDQPGAAQIWVSAETESNGLTTDTYTATAQEPIELPDGVSLLGGFDGRERDRRDRNWREHVTIIDGGVSCASCLLDGFTIQNSGGCGITCDDASYGLVSHNTITSVSVGVYCANCASPVIMNNLITGFSTCGIQAESGLPYGIDHNTIVGPGTPGSAGVAFAAPSNYENCAGSGTPTYVTYNIITDCATGILTSGFSDFSASGNDLFNNTAPGIAGQFYSDPQFSPSGNRELLLTSPYIDAGGMDVFCQERDLGANFRQEDIPGVGNDGHNVVDLGAYEYPAPPQVDRGLPTDGVNAASTAERTNIRWADSDPAVVYGDNFTMPDGNWTIDKVRVWAVPSVPGYSSYFLGDHFCSVELMVSNTGVDLMAWSAAGLVTGSNLTNNPNVRITPVTYLNGAGYLRPDGGFDQVWQIDFLNVYWNVTGGANHTHSFVVYGSPRIDRLWFNAASSDLASGDGHLRRVNASSRVIETSAVDPSGWFGGKGSDINVQIHAHLR